MSTKKIKATHAPAHEKSLFEEEADSRDPTVQVKKPRQKTKVINDPKLNQDMAKSILKASLEQINEENDVPEVKYQFPKTGDEELANEIPETTEDIEIDLETNDEESRAYFEMFKQSAVEMAHQLHHKFERTTNQSDPQVRQLYIQLGQLLRTYKSGKLPKAVNALASQTKIGDWLDLLLLTEPNHWSLNALKAVTLLFSQTASDSKLIQYYQEIVLEYLHELLENSKKLPKIVWQTLVIASKRPLCFVKGILLPLSREPSVTMKEARVISAIVTHVKLPRDHANAFIISLSENVEITTTRTIFLARFISKGQALAFRTIDAIVSYFLAFHGIQEPQPLLWHNALLEFAKKYGKDITEEQRMQIGELLELHHHPRITPEIIKVFQEVPPREEATPADEFIPQLV